jgi:hypothetical protein
MFYILVSNIFIIYFNIKYYTMNKIQKDLYNRETITRKYFLTNIF